VSHAAIGDIVLIAGKGHETYQDIDGHKQHFSDFEVAQAALRQRT
jgi:UDP-N-acetylmuramoyl-L-alanyl-D-glutamate--2,6-diaminopimelate ligase